MTGLLHSTINVREYHFQSHTIFAARVRRWGVVRLSWSARSLCLQQHSKCEGEIRLMYSPFFCNLHFSPKPINKNVTELGLEVLVASECRHRRRSIDQETFYLGRMWRRIDSVGPVSFLGRLLLPVVVVVVVVVVETSYSTAYVNIFHSDWTSGETHLPLESVSSLWIHTYCLLPHWTKLFYHSFISLPMSKIHASFPNIAISWLKFHSFLFKVQSFPLTLSSYYRPDSSNILDRYFASFKPYPRKCFLSSCLLSVRITLKVVACCCLWFLKRTCFLGAFAKLRNATSSFLMSVCPS